jgi:hypothetical protein
MTGAWSAPPLGRVANQSEIGPIGQKLGENNGESRFVARLLHFPDWVYKEYQSAATIQESKRLDQLIMLPAGMGKPDMTLVESNTAWPAVRVINDKRQTTGVLMPFAPEHYHADLRVSGGRSRRKVLLVDQLALPPEQQKILPAPQLLVDRIAVCTSVAAVGELFERHRLVYLDWSYANIFWSLTDHSCYVIDMDGTSFGPRPQIESPSWEDPRVPLGSAAGNESDRYRVALLIARCLTGMRPVADTLTALHALRRTHSAAVEQVAELLIVSLTARTPGERPSVKRIRTALDQANKSSGTTGPQTGSVKAWKPLTPPKTAAQPVIRQPGASTPGNTPTPPPRTTPPPARPSSPPPSPVFTRTGPYRPPGTTSANRPQQRPKSSSGWGGVSAAIAIGIILLILLIVLFG